MLQIQNFSTATTRRLLTIVTIATVLLSVLFLWPKSSIAQDEILCAKGLSNSQLKKIQQSNDPAWKALIGEADRLGYKIRQSEESMWGQEFTDSKGQILLISLFDLESRQKKSPAALLYASYGKEAYRAILEGAPEKLESAKESYLIKEGNSFKLSQAKSWKSCLLSTLKSGTCGAACAAAVRWCPSFWWTVRAACIAGVCGGCYTVTFVNCFRREGWF